MNIWDIEYFTVKKSASRKLTGTNYCGFVVLVFGDYDAIILNHPPESGYASLIDFIYKVGDNA